MLNAIAKREVAYSIQRPCYGRHSRRNGGYTGAIRRHACLSGMADSREILELMTAWPISAIARGSDFPRGAFHRSAPNEKQSRTAIAVVSMRPIQRQDSDNAASSTCCTPARAPSFTVSTAKLHQIFPGSPPQLTRLAFPRATSETGARKRTSGPPARFWTS